MHTLQTDCNWLLTGRDCPCFAFPSQAALVSCGNEAVVDGGGLQVFHDSGEVGVGEGNRFSGGLRNYLQVVELC